jgi:hypothetical protein
MHFATSKVIGQRDTLDVGVGLELSLTFVLHQVLEGNVSGKVFVVV